MNSLELGFKHHAHVASRSLMGPWRLARHHPAWLCLRRFTHSSTCLDSDHRPYWLTRESSRDDDKANLVRQVLDLSDELSIKDVLGSWVRKLGSGARYVRYEQVARTVNAVLQELGQKGHPRAALQVFQWMQLQGWCKLDPHLYTTVIGTLGSSGCLDLAEKIFTGINDSVHKDTVLYNSLLHARSQAGHVDAALELFNAMKERNCRPDLYTYNTIMNMYVKADIGLSKVLSVFKEMCLLGIQPDVVSYDTLLAACASGEHVKEAQRIFGAMKKRGVKPTVVTYTSLITVYAKAG